MSAARHASIVTGQDEPIFNWTRFWAPPNSRIHMGGLWDETQGFLADPEDGFIGRHSNSHLRTTPQLLTKQPGCTILFGDPGMGKTQALRSILPSQAAGNVIALEFRDIPDTGRFERATIHTLAWAAWRGGTGLLTVVIDGVDEGLFKIAGFVDYLTGLIRAEPVERLQLILACRSLEWPSSEGQRLMALWNGKTGGEKSSGIHELCPLRERDARLAAQTMLSGRGRMTADGFIRSVRRSQVVGLATRPLTLKMLLLEFVNGGGFSGSHRDLYRRYSHSLCGEHDVARQHRLRDLPSPRLHVSQEIRERVAGRIAALFLVCGRASIWTGKAAEATGSDLTVSEICSGLEHLGDVEFTVTPAMVSAVLESPLFWPKEKGRIGFYHQTFAECLAAEYLSSLPFPQLRSLLCRRDKNGEFVLPPLAELAAWVATDAEQFLGHLLANDPETLLRSDVSAIKENHKAALVRAVLAKAEAAELFDARGNERFFHTLKHPKMAGQLRSIIQDPTKNQVVRRIALRMAQACSVTELFDDCLARLLDTQDADIHSLAAASLGALAKPSSMPRLVRFLTQSRKQPLSAGVQLSILHALLNRGHWTLSQSLPHLEEALRGQETSGHALAQHGQPTDAEALLRACLRWNGCFDSLSRYHYLVRKAHDLGLARIGEPRIRRLMAHVWWRARVAHQQGGFSAGIDRGAPDLRTLLLSDASLRRRFIDDVVSLPKISEQENWLFLTELIVQEDFPLLFARSRTASPSRRMVYARLAAGAFNCEKHSAYWDQLLIEIDRSSELSTAFSRLRPWPLDSESTKQQKKYYYEALEREAEQAREKASRVEPAVVWAGDLARLASEKPVFWVTLAYRLSYRIDGASDDSEVIYDIRSSPGWKFHSKSARRKIIAGARRFISQVAGNPRHSSGSQSEFDVITYAALFLLRKEIRRSRPLAAAVRRHWLPIICPRRQRRPSHTGPLWATYSVSGTG